MSCADTVASASSGIVSVQEYGSSSLLALARSRRRTLGLLVVVALAGCDAKKETPVSASHDSGAPVAVATKDASPVDAAHEATSVAHDASADDAARLDGGHGSDARPAHEKEPPKTYKTVVHMGDSMVGGGLCKALAPKFKAEGTKFVRDVVESISIAGFDESDRIPTLMKRYNPDLVLITLGANDVFNDHPGYMTKHIESIVKKIGHRDCIWIGPPLWKGDKGLVEVIRDHAAPCRFYDSQHLVLPRAGDGIHPTEKGGEIWADAFWPFFKGEVDSP